MDRQNSRHPAPDTAVTAVLVVARNRNVRAQFVSDLQSIGYLAYGAGGAREAMRMVAALKRLDVLLCDVTKATAGSVVHLAAHAKTIRPALTILGIFRLARILPGDHQEVSRRLWLKEMIEAVLEAD